MASNILKDHGAFIFRVKQSFMDCFTLKMGTALSFKMLGANEGDIVMPEVKNCQLEVF